MDLTSVSAVAPARGPQDFRDGDAWLAGGTWLFSEPQALVRRLLDLTALGWPPLTQDEDGLTVAATCTIAQLAAWGRASAHRAAPLVGQCADAFLAGWKIQTQATVGGNIVTALPAAPVVSLTAALDGVARCEDPGGGVRDVPVAELVTGDHTTDLAPGELLRSVHLPATALAARTAFRRVSLTPLGRSAALVIARQDPGGGAVLTVTAATRRPVQLRWPSVAAAGSPDDVAAAVDAAVGGGGWHDDVHGLPAWRRAMALRLSGEVLADLAESSQEPAR